MASDDELTRLDSHQIVRSVEVVETFNFPREGCFRGGFVGWFGDGECPDVIGAPDVTLNDGLVSVHDLKI